MKPKNMSMIRQIGWLVLLLGMVTPAFSKTIYVKQGASGNGTSWTSAYGLLQSALDNAVSGDEIWVAKGTYYPTKLIDGVTNQFKTFQMKNGVKIYGGFAGTETSLTQRDIYNNETFLSGDLNNNDGPDFTNNADNCHHVFYHPSGTNLNNTAILDGFTIKGGYAHSTGSYRLGGGMYNYNSSPKVINCTFIDNAAQSGGGMGNYYYSSPTVTNCTFTHNWGGYYGGGMINDGYSSPAVTNCIFSDNIAATYLGGGMYNTNSSPQIINCTFSGNTAGYYGGGICNYAGSTPSVTNCILWNNSAVTSGNEIYNSSSTPVITYTNVKGGYTGTGNKNAEPLFENPADGDLQLQSGSPCIDAANGNPAPSTDLLGKPRYDDPAKSNTGAGIPTYADIGAYEFHGTVSEPSYVTLTTSVSPAGAGTVTKNPNVTDYVLNELVQLTATAGTGYTFSHWSGSISSTSNPVTITMNANKSVTANFTAVTTPTYTLSVSSSGAASVPITSTTGHGGTTNYTKTVNSGTTVTLTAPSACGDATFTGWTGAVTSSSPTISLTMNANKSVTANYMTPTTTNYTLSVSSSGASRVKISSTTGHSGTTNYTKTVNSGTTVTLTAPAKSGGKPFTGWTGGITSSSPTISLAMSASKSVTANYKK